MRRLRILTLMLASALSIVVLTRVGTVAARSAAYLPAIDPTQFQATVDHPYFPLVPGTVYRFSEKAGKRISDNEVTVTHDTKVIMGVTCVVVHDKLSTRGVVVEDTYDWYAQDKQGNVWYFGEDSKEFHAKGKVSTEGSWEAGVDGAQPGIMMKAALAPGEPYRQEYRAGEAEDMGQIVAAGESTTVPFGAFTGCVRIKEWSQLEAGTSKKWYARGVGCVRSESPGEVSVLIEVTKP